jgi:hypothetical protein
MNDGGYQCGIVLDICRTFTIKLLQDSEMGNCSYPPPSIQKRILPTYSEAMMVTSNLVMNRPNFIQPAVGVKIERKSLSRRIPDFKLFENQKRRNRKAEGAQ